MKYEREAWWKLYRSEPTDQRAWPFITRATRDYLLRLPDQEDGVILKRTDDPIEDLLAVLSTRESDRTPVRTGLETLLKDGFLKHDGRSGKLWINNFSEAQSSRSPEAKRKAKARQLAKRKALDTSDCDTADTSGTENGTRPGQVTHIEKEKRKSREGEGEGEGERVAAQAPPPTPCPLDLVPKARATGVIADMARDLNETDEVIQFNVEEFQSYWTIGKGAGQRKTLWMRELREYIRRRKFEGRLLRPGGMAAQQAADPNPYANAPRGEDLPERP